LEELKAPMVVGEFYSVFRDKDLVFGPDWIIPFLWVVIGSLLSYFPFQGGQIELTNSSGIF